MPVTLTIASGLCGLISGLVLALGQSAYSFSVPIPPDLPDGLRIGYNPTIAALGLIVGASTSRQLFTGSALRLILIAILSFAGLYIVQELPHLENTHVSFLNGIGAFIVLCAAAHMLSFSFLQILSRTTWYSLVPAFVWKWAALAPKPTDTPSEARSPIVAPMWILVFSIGAAVLGLSAIAAYSTTSNTHETPAVVLPALVLLVALTSTIGMFVCERVVSLVGVTLNPSSALSMLTGTLLSILFWTELSPEAVLCCAFVVAATSGSADLVQDLLLGRAIGNSGTSQLSMKMFGAILAIPCAVAISTLILEPVHRYPAPQSAALKNIMAFVVNSDGAETGFAFLIAALLVVGSLRIKCSPLLLGVGFFLPLRLTLPLMVGAYLRAWFDKRFADNQDSKSALPVLAAAILDGFALGVIVGTLLRNLLELELHDVTCIILEALTVGFFGFALVFIMYRTTVNTSVQRK